MSQTQRRLLAILLAFALAGLGWLVAGWIVAMLGLDELAWTARVSGVFFALSLGDARLARLVGHH
jgi:hypothetical protein